MALQLRRVLVTDGIHAECAEILRAGGLEVTQVGKLTPPELIRQLETQDALLVRSATRVTEQVLAACPRLQLVGRAGTGTDNIDADAATQHGVVVMKLCPAVSTPGGNTLSAAEHTCVMIAALSRNLPAACASLKAGQWQRNAFLGTELSGKTLAVLGLGRIGREVAHRMHAFNMKITGFDPMVSAEAARTFHVEKRELADIWADADYITVHTPLIPQTANLINAETLALCKPGVRIVNVARGGIIDEEALLAALDSGHCAGAGLDVFAQEPPSDLRLVQHPAVICTPHLGANTREAQLRVARELAQQVVTAAQGGELTGLVNAAGLAAAQDTAARPWLQLAQSLGAVTALLASLRRHISLHITLNGAELEPWQSVLTSSVLVGLMSGTTPNGVNLVNARWAARAAGVTMTQSWQERSGPAVTITAQVDGTSHTVAGTLRGELPTLTELEGAHFPSGVTLDGHLLFFQGEATEQGVMPLLTSLAAADAQIVTVLTSSAADNGAVLAVRLQEPLQQPETVLLQHAKLLLQATF